MCDLLINVCGCLSLLFAEGAVISCNDGCVIYQSTSVDWNTMTGLTTDSQCHKSSTTVYDLLMTVSVSLFILVCAVRAFTYYSYSCVGYRSTLVDWNTMVQLTANSQCHIVSTTVMWPTANGQCRKCSTAVCDLVIAVCHCPVCPLKSFTLYS